MKRSSPSDTRLASLLAAAGLALGTTLLAAPSATASARVDPCIWPDTGTNLQHYFNVSTALVIPVGGCGQIRAGSAWSTPIVFYNARTWEQIPAGYQPDTANPVAELEALLTKVRLIVDEGTLQEFTVERSGRQLQWTTGDWQELYPSDPDWRLADVGTHFTLRPLSVGTHTVRGEFYLDDFACDGTSSDWNSCIPPGSYEYPETRTFTVVHSAHGAARARAVPRRAR
jgi:hypothetical protein